jgi:GT2 family glycosyltransferase
VDSPLVSTITPSFNTKKYLQGFLAALPQQTCFDQIEIVLDHNEPDEEEIEWVRDFQAEHPGRLKHQIVEKVDPIGTSMNSCIAGASADLVTIWNVDDLRTPDSIERQLRVFRERPETDFVYGDWKEVASFGETDGDLISCSGFWREEFTRSFLLGPFFMFRKSLCDRSGFFDEQLLSGADFDLAIRLAFHGEAGYADGLLGYHLNEGLGASSRPGNRQELERTVIELRYGLFDKVDYAHLPRALRYRLGELLEYGQWHPVADHVPDYDRVYAERSARGLRAGLQRSAGRMWIDDHPRSARALRAARRRLRR